MGRSGAIKRNDSQGAEQLLARTYSTLVRDTDKDYRQGADVHVSPACRVYKILGNQVS
jgi:hypothetical protein